MKTTTAAELKVGQRLADGTDYRYLGLGQSIERIVTSIKITKGGRYKIEFSEKYVHLNGEITISTQPYTNGAIIGHSIIRLF